MNIYIVTGNANKKTEIKKIINDEFKIEFVNFDLNEIQSDDIIKINEHKVKSALGIIKNRNVDNEKKIFVITEDTGLYINCLSLFPGPYVKWMMKSIGSEGIYQIVSKFKDNSCHAICVYSIYDGENLHSFKGVTHGKIVEPRGSEHFSWNNIFEPEGYKETYAQMPFEDRMENSPRYKALSQIKKFLFEELIKYNT